MNSVLLTTMFAVCGPADAPGADFLLNGAQAQLETISTLHASTVWTRTTTKAVLDERFALAKNRGPGVRVNDVIEVRDDIMIILRQGDWKVSLARQNTRANGETIAQTNVLASVGDRSITLRAGGRVPFISDASQGWGAKIAPREYSSQTYWVNGPRTVFLSGRDGLAGFARLNVSENVQRLTEAGTDKYVVTATGPRLGAIRRLKINPSRGFTWETDESTFPGGVGPVMNDTTYNWVEVGDGIFYPSRVVHRRYNRAGELLYEDIAEVDIDSLKVNGVIAATELEIEFPVGTRVQDEIAGTMRTVGAE